MPTKTKAQGNGQATALSGTTNAGSFTVDTTLPYTAQVSIQGTSAILFHKWDCDDVEAKQKASKNSAAKKTDNVEAYVYRCPDGQIGVPGEYLRQAIIGAGRYRQDPRSPRKSASDLLKAAVFPLTEVAPIGKADWDYLDKRRVTIQRNGVTRVRPAFLAGWEAAFDLQVNLPEYVPPADLLEIINAAGRFVGLADNRPTYGRFQVISFKVL